MTDLVPDAPWIVLARDGSDTCFGCAACAAKVWTSKPEPSSFAHNRACRYYSKDVDAPRAQANANLREALHRELHGGSYTHTVWDACDKRSLADVLMGLVVLPAIDEATAALRDEHARLKAERNAARAELAKWKDVLIDAAVVSWTYQKAHEDDPKALINALFAQHYREALDPAISEDAAKLKAEGAREALEQAAEEYDRLNECYHPAEVVERFQAWLRARINEER